MKLSMEWFVQHKTPVYIVGPGPEYAAPLPYLLALSIKLHDPAIPLRSRARGPELNRQIVTAIEKYPGIRYVSVWNALCPQGICQLYADATQVTPLLVDTNHLSAEGSVLLARRLQSTGEIPR